MALQSHSSKVGDAPSTFDASTPAWNGRKIRTVMVPADDGTLDATAKSGSKSSSPVIIHAPFKTRAGIKIWVQSCEPIRVVRSSHRNLQGWGSEAQGYKQATVVHCQEPVLFSLNYSVWLLPLAPLTDAFANRWYMLPDEIKLRILRQNIRSSDAITTKSDEIKTALVYHLRMTPEIAVLAFDLYYKENTFVISNTAAGDILKGYFTRPWQNNWRPFHVTYRLPPQNARHLIRRLTIALSYPDWKSNDLPSIHAAGIALLRSIADGKSGFCNLKQVVVRGFSFLGFKDSYIGELPIVFPCAGSVHLSCCEGWEWEHKMHVDHINSKIRFAK